MNAFAFFDFLSELYPFFRALEIWATSTVQQIDSILNSTEPLTVFNPLNGDTFVLNAVILGFRSNWFFNTFFGWLFDILNGAVFGLARAANVYYLPMWLALLQVLGGMLVVIIVVKFIRFFSGLS